MELGESLEDYLESILVLSKQLPQVRSVDVAIHLGYSKPSISHAVKLLINQEYVTMNPNKSLELTEKGRSLAEAVFNRHVFFTNMLEQIGVDKKTAEEDACRIEHVISEKTFEAIRRYYNETSEDELDKIKIESQNEEKNA